MPGPACNGSGSAPSPVKRFARFRRARGLALLASGMLLASAAVRAEVSKEYQIKAAYLYNFTKFVEWPPQRFDKTADPIVIGVLGQAPFGEELEKVVRDRKVNGRAISIVTLRSIGEARGVHVLFVAASHEKRLGPEDLAQLEGVLTVGETEHFASDGIVKFTTVDDKVRFEINADAADRAGLRISAQLQKLATVVRKKA